MARRESQRAPHSAGARTPPPLWAPSPPPPLPRPSLERQHAGAAAVLAHRRRHVCAPVGGTVAPGRGGLLLNAGGRPLEGRHLERLGAQAAHLLARLSRGDRGGQGGSQRGRAPPAPPAPPTPPPAPLPSPWPALPPVAPFPAAGAVRAHLRLDARHGEAEARKGDGGSRRGAGTLAAKRTGLVRRRGGIQGGEEPPGRTRKGGEEVGRGGNG